MASGFQVGGSGLSGFGPPLNSKTLNRKPEILACLVLAVVLECEILHPTTLESYILSLKS